MDLEFVGKDPVSTENHSPTVYRCAERQSWVLQGWRLDAATRATLDVPDHEEVIELPYRMLPFLTSEA